MKLLRPKRDFGSLCAYNVQHLACGDIDLSMPYKAERVFLRVEKTSVGKKQCVVLRVSKMDWQRAGWAEIVELVWMPVKVRNHDLRRFEPTFLQKDCAPETHLTAERINRFTRPRRVPDSTQSAMSSDLFFQWLQGYCFCCNHAVHAPYINQESVLKNLQRDL